MQPIFVSVNQRLKADRKPEIRRGHTGADEVARRNSDDGDSGAVQTDSFAENCRMSCKSLLPIVFADKNRGRDHKLRNADRFEGAASQGDNSKNLEVVFGNDENAGELRIACPGR